MPEQLAAQRHRRVQLFHGGAGQLRGFLVRFGFQFEQLRLRFQLLQFRLRGLLMPLPRPVPSTDAIEPVWLALTKARMGEPSRACPEGVQRNTGWRRWWIWQFNGRNHVVNIDRLSHLQYRVTLLSQSQLTWYGREAPNSVTMIKLMDTVRFGERW